MRIALATLFSAVAIGAVALTPAHHTTTTHPATVQADAANGLATGKRQHMPY